VGKRTGTSYTVLGLLALGPKTGYELVQGYARSIGQISSCSDAVLYNEPKRLVADGLVTAVEESRGKRTVAVYSIIDAGMDVLRQWLTEPPAFPVLEADPIIRTVFSDFIDLDQLRDTIIAFRAEAEARRNVLAAIGESYLAGEGLYQERMHIVMLSGRFVGFLMQAYIDWCDWALTGLDYWPEDDEGRRQWARTAMHQYLHDIGRSSSGGSTHGRGENRDADASG
jgi:PadR family transcriptional regulator, regulatory protein AphA